MALLNANTVGSGGKMRRFAGWVVSAAIALSVLLSMCYSVTATDSSLSISAQMNRDGNLTVTPSLTCGYTNEHPPKVPLIIAVYDANALAAINVQEVILADDIVEVSPAVFGDLECDMLRTYTIKAFLWEGLLSVQPSMLNVIAKTDFPNIQYNESQMLRDENNNRYIMFDDDGENSLIYDFANISFPLSIEFDMKIDNIKEAGDVFGMAMFNNETEIAGFGIYKRSSDDMWLPHENNAEQYLDINAAYAETEYYKNKWLHVETEIFGETSIERVNVKIYDETGKNLYSYTQDITCTKYDLPVNRLVFGLVYDGDKGTPSGANMCLRNLKVK